MGGPRKLCFFWCFWAWDQNFKGKLFSWLEDRTKLNRNRIKISVYLQFNCGLVSFEKVFVLGYVQVYAKVALTCRPVNDGQPQNRQGKQIFEEQQKFAVLNTSQSFGRKKVLMWNVFNNFKGRHFGRLSVKHHIHTQTWCVDRPNISHIKFLQGKT